VIDAALAHRACLGEAGLAARRARQEVGAMWQIVEAEAWAELERRAALDGLRSELEARVGRGELPASVAASTILSRALSR
jgi:LAO/AO transport system kinase